jgi:hypothetical protein
MFFELRQYRIFPGKRDQWVKFMEERIMPGQLAHGVVIVGSFVGQTEDDLYVWIRRFEDEEHFATFNATYYGSDEWKNELRPRVREMLDFPSMVITRLEATPKSVIR